MRSVMPRVRLFHRVDGALVEIVSPFAGGSSEQLGGLTNNEDPPGSFTAAAWSEARFSPDMRWCAFGSSNDGVVQIARFRPASTPHLTVVLEHEVLGELGPTRLGWSRDSRYLVAVTHGTAPRWWRFASDETITPFAGPGPADSDYVTWAPGASPRGQALGGDKRVRVHNRPTTGSSS